ncbi:ATP-binding cassette domain-containing protein [Streptomyces sp. NBC_01728]|nr:ATP-binding cassette domain-containing protein [Streptomyces sp. NBC_01719]MCX4498931.1 ATP-binding cassette domain-containing protein [Streptomyces sp. NBC_01728]
MASLRISGVTVAFGGNRALDGVALTAEPGRVTGLIGPNGAGKSTLFDVASGLRRPSSGQVFLDGHDVTRTSPAGRARRGLARTFQRLELFAASPSATTSSSRPNSAPTGAEPTTPSPRPSPGSA